MAQQVFVTEDGKKFTTMEEAVAHEKLKANEGRFRAFFESQGVTRVSGKMLQTLQAWEEFKVAPQESAA
jgi:hypothetical protein